MDLRQQEAYEAAEHLAQRKGYLCAKRLFDIVFSIAVFVFLGWLFVVVALAIKLEDPSGPALFVQERIGQYGKPFRMYKFRTMCVDAESQLEGLMPRNERQGPAFKLSKDPRVTHVGRLLRRTNIDELPQFANVLQGQMSVVGPRPPLPGEVAQYTAYQQLRLLAKPGITCYWQIDPHRDKMPFDEWAGLDLRYLHKCSIRTDLWIILHTVTAVLHGQGS